MQKGEYIIDRLLPIMVKEACQSQGVELTSFSDDWVLRLERAGKVGYIIGYKFGLNGSAEATIAQDKVATYELLSSRGVDAVEHRLIRTKASNATGWEKMFDSGSVVIKPLTGTSGHGVQICHNADEVWQTIENSGVEAWAVSPLLDIKTETRIVMLDGEMLLSYAKIPVVRGGLKFFNLGLGARPQNIQPTGEIVELAKLAISEIGLRLASVDIVTLGTGENLVLEVNDGLMVEHYARTSSEHRQEAENIYSRLVVRMME